MKTYHVLMPDGDSIKVVEAIDPNTQWVQGFRTRLDGIQSVSTRSWTDRVGDRRYKWRVD